MRWVMPGLSVVGLICVSNPGAAQGLLASIFGTNFDRACETNAKRSLSHLTNDSVEKAHITNDLCHTTYEVNAKDTFSPIHVMYLCWGDGRGNLRYSSIINPLVGLSDCEDPTGRNVPITLCQQARNDDVNCHP